MHTARFAIATILLCFSLPAVTAAEDRQLVEMPAPMQAHMLANMRDHLLALETITRLLAEGDYDQAANVAEQRLGMSSLDAHGAAHMAHVMPEGMRATGTAMHQAASRFALKARDAELDGGLAATFGGLSEVMRQCVACHESYRIH